MREKNVTNRVIAYVNENIQSGNWKVGDKLPSEHEICNTLDVSRISVRSALQHFIALGVLRSVQGKGTFLINDDTSAFAVAGVNSGDHKDTADAGRYAAPP